MSEIWRELNEYPGYAVSDHGRILNTRSDLIKHPSKNQQGILMVNFSLERIQYVRSVALLVAKTFLDYVERPSHFDTPTHLNGDRDNCRADNLVWRPRWFAVKYHRQFTHEERSKLSGVRQPIVLAETEEIFENSWDAAIKYGLLNVDIVLSMMNRTVVFPGFYHFYVLEDT